MKFLDRIEIGCNAIVDGVKVVEIIDTLIGEGGNKYFVCKRLYCSGLYLYRDGELEKPFIFEDGDL